MVYVVACKQDTNRRIMLPRDLRNLKPLELVSKKFYLGVFHLADYLMLHKTPANAYQLF